MSTITRPIFLCAALLSLSCIPLDKPALAPPNRPIDQNVLPVLPAAPLQSLTSPPQGLTSPPQGLTSPPQGLTSPPQGLTSPPQGITAPPMGITVPPQGMISPPQGMSAVTGRIMMPAAFEAALIASAFSWQDTLFPPAWAVSLDVFKQFEMAVDTESVTIVWDDRRPGADDSATAQYYLPRIRRQQNGILAVFSQGRAILKAVLPMLEATAMVTQNVDVETTAMALLKEQRAELTSMDMLESPQLQEMSRQLLAQPRLDHPQTLQQARLLAAAVPVRPRQVSRIVLPTTLELTVGIERQLLPEVHFADGSLSPRVLWSSMDPQVILVNGHNVIKGFKAGQTTLKAYALSDPGQQVLIQVTVRTKQ